MERLKTALLFGIGVLLAAQAGAASWPTTQFEVYAGEPTTLFGAKLGGVSAADFGTALDTPAFPDAPLTPELQREMEAYLYAVANHYESLGFPAPKFSSTVTGDDGQKKYRVYYYDFDDDENGDYARYGSGCEEKNFYVIHINAQKLTEGGRITAKGYGDLAHELFHAVQRATRVGIDNCTDEVGKWLNEGTAEAIGHDMAQRFRNVSVSNLITRWGLRPYNSELYQGPRDGKKAYQSSSFWRYLAERYQLKEAGYSGDLALPGPQKPSVEDLNYGYLASLWSASIVGTGEKAELQWLNNWLLSEFKTDLHHVFLQFVAVFADYASYRIEEPGWDDDRWRKGIFGGSHAKGIPGCWKVELTPAHDKRDVKLTLPLYRVGAMCIELNVGATQGPMNWNVQTTTASAALLKQLALGLNGGQQLATSAEYKEIGPSAFAADWVFTLEPNKTQYLLISNTAAQPGSTKRQDVEVRITLAGRTPAVAKPPPKAAKKSRPSEQPKPGPAGAKAARRLLQDQMQGGTNGAGSVSWNYEAGGNCSPQASWRFDCEGGISLSLGMNAGGDLMGPPPAGASGDVLNQILSVTSIDMQDVATMEQYLDETAGTSISLGIPGVDYGFTGTVNDVAIEVSGTPEQRTRGSWSTRATTEWSPCKYDPPTGTVTITEFSRTLIKGSYRGQLVEAGSSRPGWKVKCPVKPVVGMIEGEFILPAPWKHDDRDELQVDWLEQYMDDDILQMLPPGIDFDIQVPTDGSAPASGTTPAGGGDPFDALENLTRDDCACTTKERDEGLQAMQRIMMGGVTEPKPEDLRLTMCVQLCLAD